MNGSANPQWEPFVTPVPREAHASRVPLAALNVLLAASVVLAAVTLLSQNAPPDLSLYRDSFRLYRDNSIVLTAAKVIPQAAPERVSTPVPRTLPRASSLNRTQTPTGVTLASPIALSQPTQVSAPKEISDGLATRHEAAITEWPARSLALQASENGSALNAPSGSVDRPVMTIAGPMQWPSHSAAVSCRWPACQFPTIALPLRNNSSFMPLPPQLSDPWAFTFASRLANQYPEAWEMLVLPTLGGWGQTLDFGRNTRFTASPYDWRLSTQTQNGLQFSTGYPLATPLQWFGIEAHGGVSMRTAGGLEVIGSTRGLQVFQYFTTPLGQAFGAITPHGPLVGGMFTSGSVTAYVATLLSDGQPKVAGTIVLQHGNLSLVYTDTTTDRAFGVRFARGPLDLSLGMSPSETQLRLSYTPPSGPTILAFWSSTRGLNLLAVGSITFGGSAPARTQEYAAPSLPPTPSTPPTLGAAWNN